MSRLLLLVLALTACGGEAPEAADQRSTDAPWFEEVSAQWGLDFEHTSGAERRWQFPEIMSGGVGLLDFDGDGDLDVYCVQGGDLGAPTASARTNRLFENLAPGRFADVTERAGVGDTGYGMGCAAGDVDGDGDVDLYVTNLRANRLYLNQGDGTFRDATEASGAGHTGWSTSAVFTDYDGDGALDLFVTNYVNWSPELERDCFATTRADERDYCPPRAYSEPAADVLYRGRGDGTFIDVTGSAGLERGFGNGLGVVPGDLDLDGRVDFYVANDATPNNLWLQTEPGRFVDRALASGCALGRGGQAEAGMGVAAVDLEGDGDLDLFLAHLRGEVNTVYVQEQGLYHEKTALLGLAAPSRAFTGFGLCPADFDGDGWLDLFVANGHVLREDPIYDERRPYAQPNQVFRGGAGPRFVELTPRGGTHPELVESSRGAACGDLDGDGDLEVVIVNQNARIHVLENVVGQHRSWIQFRLLDAHGADALGAQVTIECAGRRWVGHVRPGTGYQASSDPRVHFGLGDAATVDSARVLWPDGTERELGALETRRLHEIRR